MAVLQTVLKAVTAKHPTLDTDPGSAAFSDQLTTAANALDKIDDKNGAQAAQTWATFAELMHRFDAHIQDTLTADADPQACGYQLGRGIAETFWALNPGAAGPNQSGQPTDATSWAFLLGSSRCRELNRLLGRLSAYFNHYTAPAISGSLVVWQKVVTTPGWWQQPTAQHDLYNQTRRWYELLLLDQDPTTLVKPFALLRNLRSAWNSIRLFLPQLLFGILSIAALFGAIWAANTSFGKTLGVTVGAVGLSLTALVGKAKNSAQALTTRLQEDAYTDLVAVAITVVPPRTDADQATRNRPLRRVISPTRRSVTAALRDRPLTTSVDPQ